jgi:hypothetical protein
VTLDGWKEIVPALNAIMGVERSERTIRRWTSLPDPLPVYGTPQHRDVLCEQEELARWWERVSHKRTAIK